MKRTSTVARLSRIAILRMKAFMVKHNCGFIIRWLGAEVAIDKIIECNGELSALCFDDDDKPYFFALTGQTPRYIRKGWDNPTPFSFA